MSGGGGNVRLEGLVKHYGAFEAVRGIDLEISEGEFFSLLGPSGCGKTTTLRMIAGFERPSGGRILLDGRDMSDTPPHRRNVNTVFQSYALFAHLSVSENVAFGLRFKRLGKQEARRRVEEALSLVQMREFFDRRPHQLSGGQQQRVALARALILNPSVLLLDEPLGALDAKLRKALQIQLKDLQERVGITFVYVTHDQEEALTMSDRIAVMSEGRVEQIGSPREVYEEPASDYVADFLGVSNLMDAEVVGSPSDGRCRVRLGGSMLVASCGEAGAAGTVRVLARPERVRVGPRVVAADNTIPGTVERVVYAGALSQLDLRLAQGEKIQCTIANDGTDLGYAQGTPVSVHIPAGALRVLPASPEVSPEADGGAMARPPTVREPVG